MTLGRTISPEVAPGKEYGGSSELQAANLAQHGRIIEAFSTRYRKIRERARGAL
jgi:hypothetical protein